MLQQSKGVPSRRALVERLQFCRWSDAVDPWLDAEVLDDAWTESLDCGGEAFAAIDLSSRRDLTAGALVWAMPDGTFEAEVTLWTPEDTLPAREVTDQAPYLKWAEQGYLQTIPGEVMDFEPVAAWLQNAADAGLTDAAYDPWRIDELVRELEKIGVLASRYGEIGVGVTLHPAPTGLRRTRQERTVHVRVHRHGRTGPTPTAHQDQSQPGSALGHPRIGSHQGRLGQPPA